MRLCRWRAPFRRQGSLSAASVYLALLYSSIRVPEGIETQWFSETRRLFAREKCIMRFAMNAPSPAFSGWHGYSLIVANEQSSGYRRTPMDGRARTEAGKSDCTRRGALQCRRGVETSGSNSRTVFATILKTHSVSLP